MLVTLSVALFSNATRVRAEELTMNRAVAVALERNRDVIAAKLDVDSAKFDEVEAGLYPNPVLGYSLGNLVAGNANPQSPRISSPGFFGQTVNTLSVSEIIDVWGKRSARLRAAGRSIALQKLLTQDAIRQVVYAVRSAFADVVRLQSELALSRETRERYDETVRLSRSRYSAGDISEAELKKVELEGLRYQNAEVGAGLELDLARQRLAALLAMPSAEQLPATLIASEDRHASYALGALVDRALAQRPDVLAAKQARWLSDAELARARREAYPDISLGVSYTHSEFTASGDNPNTLGVGFSLPLPLFDRNQANIGRARVDQRRAQNQGLRLVLEVQHEVGEAFRRIAKAQTLLQVFEGGMLERADSALKGAEKSYRAGGISLLELLEAQRTYLQTRAEYLGAVHDYLQATIDLQHAVGTEVP
jgi:cobalt-zinc-cadmium efflux system outer membrane protein